MCNYTYHHYRCCGHIAKWTVDSCAEFTNKLRQNSTNDEKFTCIRAEDKHDFLPEGHPKYCLQCELDWQKQFSGAERSTSARASSNANVDSNSSHIEGIGTARDRPILNLQAGMNLPTGNQDGSSSSRIHDTCQVGMALIPESDDHEGSGDDSPNDENAFPRTTNLNLFGRLQFNWMPRVSQFMSSFDKAYIALMWEYLRAVTSYPDEKPDINGDIGITECLTARIAANEGTFYDSSSSTPDSARDLPAPPCTPFWGLLGHSGDESPPLFDGYGVYDWLPSIPDVRMFDDDDFPYNKGCGNGCAVCDLLKKDDNRSSLNGATDNENINANDSEVEPFFVLPVLDVDCNSPSLSRTSVQCNASNTDTANETGNDGNNPNISNGDRDPEDDIELINWNILEADLDPEPEYVEVIPDSEHTDSDTSETLLNSDAGAQSITPPSSPRTLNGENEIGDVQPTRPRLHVRVPGLPFAGEGPYNIPQFRPQLRISIPSWPPVDSAEDTEPADTIRDAEHELPNVEIPSSPVATSQSNPPAVNKEKDISNEKPTRPPYAAITPIKPQVTRKPTGEPDDTFDAEYELPSVEMDIYREFLLGVPSGSGAISPSDPPIVNNENENENENDSGNGHPTRPQLRIRIPDPPFAGERPSSASQFRPQLRVSIPSWPSVDSTEGTGNADGYDNDNNDLPGEPLSAHRESFVSRMSIPDV